MKTLVVTNSQGALAVVGSVVEETEGNPVVGSASTAQQAFDAIRRLHPDVVIVDMQTPNAGAHDLLENIYAAAEKAAVIAVCDSDGNLLDVKAKHPLAVVLWAAISKKLPWILQRIAERQDNHAQRAASSFAFHSMSA